MRVLLIGLNYTPESTSIGPYTADLAKHLQNVGHEVFVSTGFPTAPQWKVWDGYQGRYRMRETIDGVPVQRTWLYVPQKPRKALQRILFDCSFALSAFLGNLFTRVDLVVVISPPLQAGLTGWLIGMLNGAPCFFHIKDLVPDAAIAVGAMHEGTWPVRVAHALERFVYRRMAGIGVITPGFATNLERKGVPAAKIALLPDYIDPEFVQPGRHDNEFRAANAIPRDAFIAMYSGSVALKQGLKTFVETAAQLREHPDILFYLIGEGPYLGELKGLSQSLGLSNLRFLPLQPRAAMPLQLAAADALVVTQTKAVTDIVFPGKLLYYMAAGRPILAAVSSRSETGSFISSHKVGLVSPPEDAPSLAASILRLKENPEFTAELGSNGRNTCLQMFDRSKVLARFTAHLESLAAGSRRPAGAVAKSTRDTGTSV